MWENVFVLIKYVLIYLGAMCCNVSNLISKLQVKIRIFIYRQKKVNKIKY